MTQDAWPSPDAPSGPLPRIDELPIAEQGYEQEAVRLAFDSFYRHAAQLDASLRALEAVEVFRRDADALRNDLRAFRELGLGGLLEPAWPSLRYETPPREMPTVVLRLAFEAALIVAVAVVAAVAHFRPLVVVGLMAGAFVIVALSEWLAARARFVSPAGGFAPAPASPEAEAVPQVAPSPPVWPAPVPSREPEALTMVGSADDVQAAAEPPVEEPEPSVEVTDEQPALVEDTEAEEPAPAAVDEEHEEPVAAEVADEPVPAAPADVAEADAVHEDVAPEDVAPEDKEPPSDAQAEQDEDDVGDEEPAFDPWEQHLAGDAAGEEPELAERGGFFRRRRR